jgi:hypothetical protein
VDWNGRDSRGLPVPAGVYLLRMNAGDHVCARKLILVD